MASTPTGRGLATHQHFIRRRTAVSGIHVQGFKKQEDMKALLLLLSFPQDATKPNGKSSAIFTQFLSYKTYVGLRAREQTRPPRTFGARCGSAQRRLPRCSVRLPI